MVGCPLANGKAAVFEIWNAAMIKMGPVPVVSY